MLFWGNSKKSKRSPSNSSHNSSNKSQNKITKQKSTSAILPSTSPKTQISQKSQPIIPTELSKKYPVTNKQLNIKYHITEQQLNSIKTIFNIFDQDQDGLLSLNQLDNLLQHGNQSINLMTVRQIFNHIKSTKEQGISLQNLLNILTLNNSQLDKEREIFKIFKGFDKKNKGYFDFQDYFIVSKTIKQQIDIFQLKQAFDFMDEDKDGVIRYREFKKIMNKNRIVS